MALAVVLFLATGRPTERLSDRDRFGERYAAGADGGHGDVDEVDVAGRDGDRQLPAPDRVGRWDRDSGAEDRVKNPLPGTVGRFDRGKGAGVAKGSDSGRVRAALIDAVSSGDHRRLAELCTAHRVTIGREFSGWARVPAEVRADPAAVQRHAGALIAVAHFFATQLGDSSLIDAMVGPSESNPVLAWQRALGRAQQLMGELRYGDARQVLSKALAEARGLEGSAVDSYLPVTYGKLGD